MGSTLLDNSQICYPEWWRDVQRSLDLSFAQYDSCLKSIDNLLYKNLFILERYSFTSLVIELEQSTRRMEQVLNIARIRIKDAKAVKLHTVLLEYNEKVAVKLASRSREMCKKLGERMKKLANELKQRRKFPPVNNIYQIPAPQCIDLQL